MEVWDRVWTELVTPGFAVRVSKKAYIRDRYKQVLHLTQDTTSESDKNTSKSHIQASQGVTPFPVGDHKAAMNRQESMAYTKHKE